MPSLSPLSHHLRMIYYMSLDQAVVDQGEQAAPLRVFPVAVPPTLAPLEIAKMFARQLADKWAGLALPRPPRKGDLVFLDAEDIPGTEAMYIVDGRVLPLNPRWNMRAWYATPLADKLRGYRYCLSQGLYREDELLPGDSKYKGLSPEARVAIDKFTDERADATQAVIDKATGKNAVRKTAHSDLLPPRRKSLILPPNPATPQ